ncbi:MAG TPA: FtsX-like permease family protein [Myxococcales bacterium]|nr:FtsX-like permease family protein [Myxococcales bacterium]
MRAFVRFFTGFSSIDVVVAFRNLLQHTRRTIFLGGAIAAVTAVMVLLVGISVGTSETMLRTATTLMSGHINVGGFYKVTDGMSAPVVTDFRKIIEISKKTLPEIDYVVARGRGWAKLISDTGSTQVGVAGIDIQAEPGFKKVIEPISGSLADLAKPHTVLIFESQAKKLDAKVGDALTFSAPTTRGVNNTVDVRVVAIAKDLGLLSSFNVYIPAVTLAELYRLSPDTTGAVQILVKDRYLDDVPALITRLRKALETAGYRLMDPDPEPFWLKFDKVNREDWTGQKLDVTSWKDELAFFNWTLVAINTLFFTVLIILLAIIVVGIMNTMWIAIRERTREIGTLRAIGMQREQVVRQFLLEALMLGVLATVGGAILGALGAAEINAAQIPVPLAAQIFLLSNHFFLAVHPTALIFAAVAITAVTGLAALYPSLRAAKLEPVTAMQHFG